MADEYLNEDEYPEDEYGETYFEEEDPYPDHEEEEIPLRSSTTIKKTRSYDVLGNETLQKKTAEIIGEVKDTLCLPTKTAATTLLRHYKWDKSKLISEYTNAEDEEAQNNLLRAAGITTFDLEKELDEHQKSKTYDCLICLESVPSTDTFALSCGHRYCRACWHDYLNIVVKLDALCIWTRCPYPKCNELVHENAFKTFCTPSNYETYENQLNRSMVLENPVTKFCPSPNCSNAIQVDTSKRKNPVLCDCGFKWCFGCADYEIGDHIPSTCEDVENWKQKAVDESENVKWMVANTKKCPACRSAIEKNGGCMHMTCRKEAGGCGHEFCWLCRGDWKEHGSHTGGYYSCNKYDASGAKEEDDNASKTKSELERYQFFFTRYEAHRDAMKIADQQRANTTLKSQQLVQKFRARPEDTTFLLAATVQLFHNRNILRNSYIYGYYIANKSTPKALFEFSQEELEKHTNHLSELYEKPLDAIHDYNAFIDWKNETIKYTSLVANYRDKFVEAIVEEQS
eukprot:TRINITY_DN18475_c0_g1_i1.p1 TRINITY_DN18475_c0_g1~~TRINITY_DN18475_c0_g1_i1.p1  ORF type:complete len:513 (+),score=84.60 TRINITY_DN18475_c0_g1_i1:22-1560(+)